MIPTSPSSSDPLVSVIMPVYMVESYIKESIDSVLQQTYSNFEILCVDDCGVDCSLEIVRKIQKQDPRVRIFLHSENRGPGAARNTGLINASGKYVAFLDSDDCLAPTFLEEMVSALEQNELSCACCLFRYMDDITAKEWCTKAVAPEGVNDMTPELASRVSNSASDKLFRVAFLRKNNLLFDEGVFYEDLGLYAKTCSVLDKLYQINKPLYIYRQRPGSTMYLTRQGKGPCKDIFESALSFYRYLHAQGIFGSKQMFLPAVYSPHFKGFACNRHYKEDMFMFAKEFFPQLGFPELYDIGDTYVMNTLFFSTYKRSCCMRVRYKIASAVSKLLPTEKLRKKWRTWAKVRFLE